MAKNYLRTHRNCAASNSKKAASIEWTALGEMAWSKESLVWAFFFLRVKCVEWKCDWTQRLRKKKKKKEKNQFWAESNQNIDSYFRKLTAIHKFVIRDSGFVLCTCKSTAHRAVGVGLKCECAPCKHCLINRNFYQTIYANIWNWQFSVGNLFKFLWPKKPQSSWIINI